MLTWLKAALIRALKTGAETMLGFIVIGASLFSIDWEHAISVSLVAMLATILVAMKGLPEVSDGDSLRKIEQSEK